MTDGEKLNTLVERKKFVKIYKREIIRGWMIMNTITVLSCSFLYGLMKYLGPRADINPLELSLIVGIIFFLSYTIGSGYNYFVDKRDILEKGKFDRNRD